MLFLGIDGGGSGCRAAVADASGRILGRGSAGPANINTDLGGAAASILAATDAALDGTGAEASDLTAVLGLAGGTISTAAEGLAARLPFRQLRVVNDAITAARGALGPDDGILTAMGTGSVFAVQEAGALRQLGGRGFLLGDEGSGAVLGRSLMARAMRAADGFEPMTPLLQEILAEHGGIEGIIGFGNRARPADFARLAPRITASDDPAAQSLFDAAVAELRRSLAVLQQGRRLDIVFTGGLGPHYAARLAGDWPQRPAAGTGVDGALAMARELARRPVPQPDPAQE